MPGHNDFGMQGKGEDNPEVVTRENEMLFATAIITISLPYRISIKEGDLYEAIEKILDNAGLIKIYPFEYLKTVLPLEMDRGSYVSNFRKIRIDVTLPVEPKEIDFSKREQQRPFLDIATEFLNIFLAHCRTKSRQFWLHPVYPNDFNMSQIWHKVRFVADNSEILYEENGSTGGLDPIGVGINEQVWDNVKNNILYNIAPSIVDYHIEEARTAIFSKSVEILIINLAVAVEVFTSRFCLKYACKINRDTDEKFTSLVKNRNKDGFVVTYFKKVIPYLISESKKLSIEHKDLYDQVDFLFRTRNNIVHDGRSFYKDDSNTEHNVDYQKAHKFFLSTMEVMEWLRNIDSAIAEELKCFIDTE